MMSFLPKTKEKKIKPPTLKLFARKDFLRELVVAKLDFYMKTNR